MNFDEYKDDVTKKVNEWLETLTSGRVKEAANLKESTGDLISGFKESFPQRKEEIQRFVDDIQADFWKAFDKKEKGE